MGLDIQAYVVRHSGIRAEGCDLRLSGLRVYFQAVGYSGLRVQRYDVRRSGFQGVLEFKTHRLVYHSTLGSSVTKKKKKI